MQWLVRFSCFLKKFIYYCYFLIQQTSMSACPAMEVVLKTVQTPMEATFAHVRLAIC